ncbi:glycosyltransferase 1 domain-containing protein 1 isoform X3 [Cyclopterus lumpus]|uniref:glycosyltransferase 1 domain-containing protein 1 isoform X3 n=1 Tax=Cyclopterus lumpus TaxID=8103 RepID=UPI001486D25A|nr:glycosyltransferase 1 domain-containing protein 1 isoform X3 [Cyclopterus lumpus]
MKLLFLACLSPKTGNHTTAERIRSHIESAGHTCELRDAAAFQSPAEVANLISRHPPFEGALAIHLHRAGSLLLDIHVPFGVIFGGTDINEDVKVEQKRVVMEQVLLKARFAVAFTDKLKEEAELFLLSQSSKIYVQPQGVSSEPVDELHVFLLVCGLRRVKDPLYLVEMFSEWHRENPLNVLVVIGPRLFSICSFFQTVMSGKRLILCLPLKWKLLLKTGVFLAQERSQRELHAAMKRCFTVVNSSVSEGMSAAILEAMDLGVPVLARDIPGNAAIVHHEFTGLLYSSPQEFVHQSQRLLSDHDLRDRLVRNGKRYVEEHHCLKRERETYQRLVDTLRCA